MEDICVIAEKRDFAEALAKALHESNMTSSKPVKKDGYFQTGNYKVTYARGHLLTLAMPEDYGITPYVAENLPIIPPEFKMLHVRQKNDKGELVRDDYVEKQLKVIENLFKNSSLIYSATDAGREGEHIFRTIYEHIGVQKPVKRLWIKNKDVEGIKTAFQSAKNLKDYDNIAEAAKARAYSDWLVGINASQALAISSNARGVSLGRVQTPTLALVCKRFIENTKFKSIPFFVAKISINVKGNILTVSSQRFDTHNEAENFLQALKKHKLALLRNFKLSEKKETAPLLHDLTSLQKTANRIHKMTLERIDAAADSLYQKGFLSYPRTSSCYIENEDFKNVPLFISNIKKLNSDTEWFINEAFSVLDVNNLNTRSVDASKIDDHGALLPTSQIPNMKELSKDEAIIYRMISQRMLQAFAPNALYNLYKADVSIGDNFFSISSSEIKFKGFKMFDMDSEITLDTEDSEEEANNEDGSNGGSNIIAMKNLSKFNTDNFQGEVDESSSIQEGKTKPKPIYTEGTLVEAMETCGKEVQDSELREALKANGIGMPSTRRVIITQLIDREYIARDKQKLKPTDKGMAIYNAVKNNPIASVNMTGQWESALKQIESGTINKEQFLIGIKKFTDLITKELLNTNIQIQTKQDTHTKICTCPKCKEGEIINIKTSKVYFCSNNCGLFISKTMAQKTISPEIVKQLATGNQTATITGFTSQKGTKFNAKLALDMDSDFKTTLVFEDNKKSSLKKSLKIKTATKSLTAQDVEHVFQKDTTSINYLAKQFENNINARKKFFTQFAKSEFKEYMNIDKQKVTIEPVTNKLKCSVLLKADITATYDANNIQQHLIAMAKEIFSEPLAKGTISEIKVNIYYHNNLANFECLKDVNNNSSVKQEFKNISGATGV